MQKQPTSAIDGEPWAGKSFIFCFGMQILLEFLILMQCENSLVEFLLPTYANTLGPALTFPAKEQNMSFYFCFFN